MTNIPRDAPEELDNTPILSPSKAVTGALTIPDETAGPDSGSIRMSPGYVICEDESRRPGTEICGVEGIAGS